jgi:hypothetical protein
VREREGGRRGEERERRGGGAFDRVPTLFVFPPPSFFLPSDGMAKADWLALVAVHSDAWLRSVAAYCGAKLDATDR